MRPVILIALLCAGPGGPAAAQTVLNGGNAIGDGGGAKRVEARPVARSAAPAQAAAPEAEPDTGGLLARAQAVLQGALGGGAAPSGPDAGAIAAALAMAGGDTGAVDAEMMRKMFELVGEGMVAGEAFPQDGSLVEKMRALGALRDGATERAAALGSLVADDNARVGTEARLRRMVEEAERASRPLTPLERLFAEYGRAPGAVTPYEASRAAAARQHVSAAGEAPDPAVPGAEPQSAATGVAGRILARLGLTASSGLQNKSVEDAAWPRPDAEAQAVLIDRARAAFDAGRPEG